MFYIFKKKCVCVSGVGHGAAERGEQAVNRLCRQRAPSLGHQLPRGGEDAQAFIYHFLFMNKCHIDDPASVVVKAPSLSQAKAEGEPEVKKGKTLLEENDDDEDNEEGVDESPEEVRENQWCKYCNKVHWCVMFSTQLYLLLFMSQMDKGCIFASWALTSGETESHTI